MRRGLGRRVRQGPRARGDRVRPSAGRRRVHGRHGRCRPALVELDASRAVVTVRRRALEGRPVQKVVALDVDIREDLDVVRWFRCCLGACFRRRIHLVS